MSLGYFGGQNCAGLCRVIVFGIGFTGYMRYYGIGQGRGDGDVVVNCEWYRVSVVEFGIYTCKCEEELMTVDYIHVEAQLTFSFEVYCGKSPASEVRIVYDYQQLSYTWTEFQLQKEKYNVTIGELDVLMATIGVVQLPQQVTTFRPINRLDCDSWGEGSNGRIKWTSGFPQMLNFNTTIKSGILKFYTQNFFQFLKG